MYQDDPGETMASGGSPEQPAPKAPTLSPELMASHARANAASDKVTEILNERPQRTQPNRWQRLAAGLIGGGAGFINAGGRVRIDPQTTQGAVEGVTGETGFQRRDEDWRRRLDAVSKQAQIEGEKVKAQQGAEEFAGDQRLKSAHAGYYEGQEWRARQPRPEPVEKPTLVPRGGKLVGADGNVIADNPIPKPPDPIKPPNKANPGQGIQNADGTWTVPVPARPQVDHSAQVDERKRRAVVSSAASAEIAELGKAEREFATAKRQLDARFDGKVDPKTKKKRPTKEGSYGSTINLEYDAELSTLENRLLAEKEAAGARRAASVSAYGENYQPPKYPNPREQRGGGGMPPAGQPSGATSGSGRVRVRLRDGQTGSVEAADFDPRTMEKL